MTTKDGSRPSSEKLSECPEAKTDSQLVSEVSEATRLILDKTRDAVNWQRFNRFSRSELASASTAELVRVFIESSRISDYKRRAYNLLVAKAINLGDKEAADSLIDIIWRVKGGVRRRLLVEWALEAGVLGEGRYSLFELIDKLKELILVEVARRIDMRTKDEIGYYLGLARKLVATKILPLLDDVPPASVIKEESQGGEL